MYCTTCKIIMIRCSFADFNLFALKTLNLLSEAVTTSSTRNELAHSLAFPRTGHTMSGTMSADGKYNQNENTAPAHTQTHTEYRECRVDSYVLNIMCKWKYTDLCALNWAFECFSLFLCLNRILFATQLLTFNQAQTLSVLQIIRECILLQVDTSKHFQCTEIAIIEHS